MNNWAKLKHKIILSSIRLFFFLVERLNDASRSWKANAGCDEWSKVEIYIFFSFCSSFELHNSHRISSTRKLYSIRKSFSTVPTHFECSALIEVSSTRGNENLSKEYCWLLDHISTTRNLSKFQPAEENKHVKRIFSSALMKPNVSQ
jgi:hypothetical protein